MVTGVILKGIEKLLVFVSSTMAGTELELENSLLLPCSTDRKLIRILWFLKPTWQCSHPHLSSDIPGARMRVQSKKQKLLQVFRIEGNQYRESFAQMVEELRNKVGDCEAMQILGT